MVTDKILLLIFLLTFRLVAHVLVKQTARNLSSEEVLVEPEDTELKWATQEIEVLS